MHIDEAVYSSEPYKKLVNRIEELEMDNKKLGMVLGKISALEKRIKLLEEKLNGKS